MQLAVSLDCLAHDSNENHRKDDDGKETDVKSCAVLHYAAFFAMESVSHACIFSVVTTAVAVFHGTIVIGTSENGRVFMICL